MPLDYLLSVYRGDSYRWRFTLWADAAKTIPSDLAGVVAAADIRATPTGAVVASLACTVTDHHVDVVLAAADSQALPTIAAWDLQLTYPAGDVKTIAAGAVTVGGDVTRVAAVA